MQCNSENLSTRYVFTLTTRDQGNGNIMYLKIVITEKVETLNFSYTFVPVFSERERNKAYR